MSEDKQARQRNSQKSRLVHVAELAGVSLSTVDRVLNERGSVSDAKRRKVLAAAKTLGLRRVLPSPVHGLLRFDLLMVDSPSDHFQRLAEAFLAQAEMHHSRLVLQRSFWPEGDVAQLVYEINTPRPSRQGLIVVAQDTPQVRQALQAQIDQGIPVVLVTTSLSGLPATYVGIDNQAAGRTAARLICQCLRGRQGRVLLLTNSLLYEAHRQRVAGFEAVMQAQGTTLEVVGPIEYFDDDLRSASAVQTALEGGELAGLYTTGSASAGVARILREHGARPVWIGHEASAQHADMLREGLMTLVLDQDPQGQAEAAIQHLLHAHGDLDTPPQVTPQLHIIIEDNLPAGV